MEVMLSLIIRGKIKDCTMYSVFVDSSCTHQLKEKQLVHLSVHQIDTFVYIYFFGIY